MTVEPGFGGQKFIPEIVDKLRDLKKIISTKKLNLDLEVDGWNKLSKIVKLLKKPVLT